MKRLSFLIHRIALAIFIVAGLGAVSASAQTNTPILECIFDRQRYHGTKLVEQRHAAQSE